MRASVQAFLSRHALFDATDHYAQTVVDFVRFCTPVGASADALATACMYAAWVLFLDDDPGRVTLVDPAAAFVATGSSAAATPPAIVEIVDSVNRIAAAKGLAPAEFLDRLIGMMRAQQREHTCTRYDEIEYLRFRPDTIGSRGLVALMKLDAQIDLGELDPLAHARARLLEELSTRLVYVSNDIFSSHREEHEPGTFSIVRVVAEKRGIAWAEATEAAAAIYDGDMAAYLRVRDELLAATHPAAIDRLIAITDAAAAGHLVAMDVIGSRYRRTSA